MTRESDPFAPEWTIEEWRAEGLDRKHQVRHECDGDCGGVFRCRSLDHDNCGRFVGWCLGGSDDNRCNYCWHKRQVTIGEVA